ncbi:putative FCP1 domain, HAD superfamily protein [Septoria linicola]|nr:putative FCP1 domain, HAD superfamily protein [Septoria linicola]
MLAVTQRYLTPPDSGDEDATKANQNMKLCRDGKENHPLPSLTAHFLPSRPSHLPPSPPYHNFTGNGQEAGQRWSTGRPAGEAVSVTPVEDVQAYNYGTTQQYGHGGWGWQDWQQYYPAHAQIFPTSANTSYSQHYGHGNDWYALQQQPQQAYGYSHYPAPASSSQLNADAQDFIPFAPAPQVQSVPVSLLARLQRVNKKARYPADTPSGFKPAPTKKLTKKQKAAAKALAESASSTSGPAVHLRQSALPQAFQLGRAHGTAKPKLSPAQRRENAPRLHMMERPQPTTLYYHLAAQEPRVLPSPRPLLVVIDLNGTLLKRTKFSGTNKFTARPYLYEFLSYVLANHKLMIWSSARPENVATMCSNLFTPEQRKQLVAVWARDTLRLSDKAYNEKVQVYKQLSWIWNDTKIQSANPDKEQMWGQSNTVLIDDSIDKAASEPHNLLEVEEFEGQPEQIKSDSYLNEAMHYLSTLSCQVDVSAYMSRHRFKVDSQAQSVV